MKRARPGLIILQPWLTALLMKARAGQSIKHEFLVHILSGTWQKVADRWIGKLGWLGDNYF